MSNQTVESFYNFIAQNKNMYEDLIESAGKIFDDDDLRSFIKNKLLPIAKKYGYDFTEEDLFKYEKSQFSKLSDSDLEDVAGGFSLKRAKGFMSLALVLGSTFAPMSAKAMEPSEAQVGTVLAGPKTSDSNEGPQHNFKVSKILTNDEVNARKEAFLEQVVEALSLKDISESRKILSDDLSRIRKIISEDFENSTVEYVGYEIFKGVLEDAGPEYYPYVDILSKTKSIDKCLNLINNIEHIQYIQEKCSNKHNYAINKFEELLVSSPGLYVLDDYNFLVKEGPRKYGLGRMAVDKLSNKINKYAQMFSEYDQGQIVKNLNKGKFIDATIALERALESYKPIPVRTVKECLNAYVNLGGPLGCEAIQNQLRGISKMISKNQTTGFLTVNFEPEAYRQLKDAVKQLSKSFESYPIDEQITTYRGINREGLLSLLRANGVKISDEDVNVETLSNIFKNISIKDDGFISTSKSEKIAHEFAKRNENWIPNDKKIAGAIFEVDLPSGTRAIDINKTLSTKKFEREEEILLQNGTEFKIKEVTPLELDGYKGIFLRIKVEANQLN